MSIITPPLSLYIHIPWCIKKCPYCDFNSHVAQQPIPYKKYAQALILDLKQDLEQYSSALSQRPIISIFFGGGTPSLMPPDIIGYILEQSSYLLDFAENIEISLEINPGTHEYLSIADLKLSGINRVSLGAQSFQDDKLKALGRIHSAKHIYQVIKEIQKANFNNYNIDIMYGLPKQSLDNAIYDLQAALNLKPQHISWYNLTLEPNTLFHKYPPKSLPDEDLTENIENMGKNLLLENNFSQYEVSAFSQPFQQCKHNLNYWMFGDYLGIGAGAHGKITDPKNNSVTRFWKTRQPQDYLNNFSNKNNIFCQNNKIKNNKIKNNKIKNNKILSKSDLVFEFMLNNLRLIDKIPITRFTELTGLPISHIMPVIKTLATKKLLEITPEYLTLTSWGRKFLNNILENFAPK